MGDTPESDSEIGDAVTNDDVDEPLTHKKSKREKSKERSKVASPKRQKSVDKKDTAKSPSDDNTDDDNENAKPKAKKEDLSKNGSGPALTSEPRLPVGWMRKAVQRQNGVYAGKFDVYIYSPDGKKFRSRVELARHFEKTSSSLNIDDFNFNRNDEKPPTKQKAAAKPKKEKSEPIAKNTKSERASKKTKAKSKKATTSKQHLVVKLNFSAKNPVLESLKEAEEETSEEETSKSPKRKKVETTSKSKSLKESDTSEETSKSPKRRKVETMSKSKKSPAEEKEKSTPKRTSSRSR